MDLKETMDEIGRVMCKTKEEWLETKPEETDIGIYLHCYRDEKLVAAVQCPLDRDSALAAGQIAATGFNAEVMSITFESYHSLLPQSPLTGKGWRPHEMQYVAETDPEAFEKGWVSECLMTSIHERGGGFGMLAQPYQIRDGVVVWGEPAIDDTSADGTNIGGGYMFEYLQEVMSKPTMDSLVREQADANPVARVMSDLITDPETRFFHMDMATYRRLDELKLATHVLFAAETGSEREKWLIERLGPPQVIRET